MPRLFMHLRNGDGLQRDERGEDYDSEHVAVQQAARSAGSMLSDDLLEGKSPTELTLMIEREDGTPVATIEASGKIQRFDGSAA